MNSPNSMWPKLLIALAVAGSISACAPDSNGPTANRSVRQNTVSPNASDYYYRKDAGWVYTYSNVQRIFDGSGGSTSYAGANDIVTTLGPTGLTAPTGEPLYAVSIMYSIQTAYAGRGTMDVTYIPATGTLPGAFVQGTSTLPGALHVNKSPRPVSTDTILAGLVGPIRTTTDNYVGTNPTVYQIDTIYFTATGDNVAIWEHPSTDASSWIKSRQVFNGDMTDGATWNYDVVDGSTVDHVSTSDMSVAVPAGVFGSCARVDVSTPASIETLPVTEFKWFAAGTGVIKQKDHWFVTTDGINRIEEDFTRSLMTLTHQ